MSTKHIVAAVIVAVVFAAGGFFGGMKYEQNKASAAQAARIAQFGGRGGQGSGRGFNRGAGTFLAGQVLSVSGNDITVKLLNGGSQIAVLAPSTQYSKSVTGSSTDVSVGQNILVTGSQNSDGSITAQSVQIRNGSSTPISIGR